MFYLKKLVLELCFDCLLLYIFATLDTNMGEVEGEEFGEGFEEDQGLANQGKPYFDL
jgi:hypothetical protein